MFGYVIPDKPNMLIKDYAEYRAYYCGVCKAIGKRNGQLKRFTLNYDITLLALFAVNIKNATPKFINDRCVAHPITKRQIAIEDDVFATIADINMILGYYKAVDDVTDEKSTVKKLARIFLHAEHKRASKRLPELDKVCKFEYERLAKLESEKNHGIDAYADPFATILKETGKVLGGDDNFCDLCYNLGRWVYFIDAADDLEKDIKKHRFNPFVVGKQELNDEEKVKILEQIRGLLNIATYKIKEAYNKMNIVVSEGPLSNIIYLGLDARAEEVLNKRCKNEKKSI